MSEASELARGLEFAAACHAALPSDPAADELADRVMDRRRMVFRALRRVENT